MQNESFEIEEKKDAYLADSETVESKLKAKRWRRWLLTEFEQNIVESWRCHCEELDTSVFRYCQAQLELCPETNRLHIQAYLETVDKDGISLKKLKETWGSDSVHCV